jgi:hypothetical protein
MWLRAEVPASRRQVAAGFTFPVANPGTTGWSARYEATFEQHFADWKIKDNVSGKTDCYDDFLVTGVRLGLTYRF